MLGGIEIADDQVYYVGEVVRAPKSRGAAPGDPDVSVDALSGHIGEGSLDVGDDVVVVISQRANEGSHGRLSAFQCSGHPALEEGLGATEIGVAPEVLDSSLSLQAR